MKMDGVSVNFEPSLSMFLSVSVSLFCFDLLKKKLKGTGECVKPLSVGG